MDTIVVQCRGCGTQFNIGKKYLGKRFQCPKCAASNVVSDSGAGTTAKVRPPEARPAPPRTASSPEQIQTPAEVEVEEPSPLDIKTDGPQRGRRRHAGGGIGGMLVGLTAMACICGCPIYIVYNLIFPPPPPPPDPWKAVVLQLPLSKVEHLAPVAGSWAGKVYVWDLQESRRDKTHDHLAQDVQATVPGEGASVVVVLNREMIYSGQRDKAILGSRQGKVRIYLERVVAQAYSWPAKELIAARRFDAVLDEDARVGLNETTKSFYVSNDTIVDWITNRGRFPWDPKAIKMLEPPPEVEEASHD